MKLVDLLCLFALPLGGIAVAAPALAAGCPGVEVVFARGTGEPVGVGSIGQDFVNALRTHTRSVGVYAVDYPATMDFGSSTMAGINDAGAHIQYMTINCPTTRMVLGGFSQGAAVSGFVTSAAVPDGAPAGAPNPMDSSVVNHVAAVVLFGTPSPQFMGMIGQPPIAIGPAYGGKTMQLCTFDDPVCGDLGLFGGNWAAHNSYTENGMVASAANYAADRI